MTARPAVRVRELRPATDGEVDWIAARMRRTLEEVVDPVEGAAMYSLEWLRDRVRQHLDPARLRGAVFLAEDAAGERLGYAIVRVETEEPGEPGERGLFSTIWVEPERRREGVAGALQEAGEAWMRAAGQVRATTWTACGNEKLIRSLQKRSYAVEKEVGGMVRLGRTLGPGR